MSRHLIGVRSFSTAVAALTALMLLATPALAQAPPGDPGSRAREPERGRPESTPEQSRSRDFNEVAAEARDKGKTRVIVGLPVAFTPEGDASSSRRQAQRSEIAKEQQDVRRDLAGKQHTEIYAYAAIPFMALEVSEEAVEALRTSQSVSSIELDLAHRQTLADSSPLVEANTMWGGGFTGAGTVVAILDTGVDKTHSFFGGRVVEEACYSSGTGSSDPVCPNGQTSQTGPGSGVNCSASVSGCSHGTHVAGIAAGSGTTFHGVARGANIMSVQVFSRENSGCSPDPNPCLTAWTSDIIKGLERVYALRATHNFAAVNLSLSGGAFTSACDASQAGQKAAIDNLLSVGIATAAATGNESSTDSIGSPACVSTAVAVGSTTKQDAVSSFSNGHPTLVDVLAPGSSITSSVPGGGFASFNGTSMATPHVTGAFALLNQKSPDLSVDELLFGLENTGLPVTDSRGSSSFTTPRIRIAQASGLLDGVVYEELDVPDFTVVSEPNGGEPVVFTVPGGEINPGDVIGFSFIGTASGVTIGGSWASDTCMTLQAPDGTDYTVGGFNEVTPGCGLNDWDFQGEGSGTAGVYQSLHSLAFQPPVDDQGDWTLTFTNDWDDTDAADIAWTNVKVTLHKLPADDPPSTLGDYDGDGDTDIAVFRASNSTWYLKDQLTVKWGLNGDIPVPGDYDNDGDTDIAVFRPSNGIWYVKDLATTKWGVSTDIPVPGDYDGDGDTDIAVYRPSNGTWYVKDLATTKWGVSTDIPVPGDYDGDGDTDIAVYRPSNGTWYVKDQTTTKWGVSTDIPVPRDYDGDGDTDLAVYRPSNGTWYIKDQATTKWGVPTDVPVPGDYDGDGSTDIAVFRPTNGTWYVKDQSTTQWGVSTDVPLPLPAAIYGKFF